jgi:hypothetical protein
LFTELNPNHYAAPVIREMIEADPLKRIDLANAKVRLQFFCNLNLRTLTTVNYSTPADKMCNTN